MALSRIGANWTFGVGDITPPTGMAEVTGFEAGRELSTQIEGKGADGEVKAFLYGNEKNTMSLEGYSAADTVPPVGQDIAVAGCDGKVMRSSITGSNEDFMKVRLEGVGFPNI